jgi:hypothetical protein
MARYFLGLQKQVPNHGAKDMILVQSTRYSCDRAEKIFPTSAKRLARFQPTYIPNLALPLTAYSGKTLT